MFAAAHWEHMKTRRDASTSLTCSALLDSSSWLREQFPEVFHQLYEYEGSAPAADRDFMYWSRERYGFGLKPLLNLYHVTIHHPGPNVAVIASKQIRSSHYFDGRLA